MLLAACGSGGSVDTPMTSGPLDDHPLNRMTPPKPTGPVISDTIISSPLIIDDVTIKVNCTIFSCETEAPIFQDDLAPDFYRLDLDETAFNRNGAVNGPITRKVSHDSCIARPCNDSHKIHTAYDYWMGDSMFSVVNLPYTAFGMRYQDYGKQYAMASGNNTGSRPLGSAAYSGDAVAVNVSRGSEWGELHHGIFTAGYDFGPRTITIDISFGRQGGEYFSGIGVASDGSFKYGAHDSENIRGTFFGSNHNEVAGTFYLPDDKLVGAFGGIKN